MKTEFFLASRYLLRRKKTGFISLISLISMSGVAIGVMALIVVLAVMTGFSQELKQKIVGVHPHLLIQKYQGVEDIENLKKVVQEAELPKLKSVEGYVEGQAIIKSDRYASGALVKGIEKQAVQGHYLLPYMRYGEIQLEPEQKDIDDEAEPIPGVILGHSLGRLLGVKVGDTVQLISPVIEKKGMFRSAAKTQDFRVTGMFHIGMHDVDSTLVMISIDQAQLLYDLGDKVSGASIKLTDVYWAERVKEGLYDLLGRQYWIQSWMDMNRNFFSALKVEKRVMTILLFLIILVAAFNIVSTLIMVVMEKTRDIAVLKAIGASESLIHRIFLLQAFIIGGFGTTCGVLMGVFVTHQLNPLADLIKKYTGFEFFPSDIYFFDRIPTVINYADVGLIAFFGFMTTLLAGVYPAVRASRLKPAEALRYE